MSHSQAVSAGIIQINTAFASFRLLVDAIGTSKDTPQHCQKIHDTRQRILQLVKDTLAKLNSLSESDRASDVNPSKKLEDAKLARDFHTTLQEFQKVQKISYERESTYSPSLPSSSLPPQAFGSDESIEQEKQAFLIDQRRQEVVLMDNEISFNEASQDDEEDEEEGGWDHYRELQKLKQSFDSFEQRHFAKQEEFLAKQEEFLAQQAQFFAEQKEFFAEQKDRFAQFFAKQEHRFAKQEEFFAQFFAKQEQFQGQMMSCMHQIMHHMNIIPVPYPPGFQTPSGPSSSFAPDDDNRSS